METKYFCVGKEHKDARKLVWVKSGVANQRVAFFDSPESAWVYARGNRLHIFAVDVEDGMDKNIRAIFTNEECAAAPVDLILHHLGELSVRLGDTIRKGGWLCA